MRWSTGVAATPTMLLHPLTFPSVQFVSFRDRFGKYPTSMFSLVRGNGTVLLPVVVASVTQRHSPHHWSYVMRCATYRLLDQDKPVLEYSQLGKNYQSVKTFHRVSGCSCQNMSRVLASLSRFAERRDETERLVLRAYLMETVLGCSVANEACWKVFANFFPPGCNNEIIFAATFFWVLHAKPPDFVVSAVLLALSDQESEFSAKVLSSFHKQHKDIDAATSYISRISEWQSCVKYALVLNKTLFAPLFSPPVRFDCTFVVELCSMLSERKNQQLLKKGTSLPESIFSAYKKSEFMLDHCSTQSDDMWSRSRGRRRKKR